MTVQSMGSGATTAFAASTMVTSPSSVSLKVSQSHGAPKYSCGSAPERRSGSCGSLQIGGRSYNFLQAHFHTPSENTVDGKQFDMEMHIKLRPCGCLVERRASCHSCVRRIPQLYASPAPRWPAKPSNRLSCFYWLDRDSREAENFQK